jgi:alkanesulfonate monooxygenase SsuD/methylene tetrahydromethanopterin reductase-like flavin-dependent oxidoreductase (luciferase family)
MTSVTCPIMRYHPAIIAQATATMGLLADNWFTLGLGAGERLNEHVIGAGWPGVGERHERFCRKLLTLSKGCSRALSQTTGESTSGWIIVICSIGRIRSLP